jgi:hypothetical protein
MRLFKKLPNIGGGFVLAASLSSMCRKALQTETGNQCHNFVSPSHLLTFSTSQLPSFTGNRKLLRSKNVHTTK